MRLTNVPQKPRDWRRQKLAKHNVKRKKRLARHIAKRKNKLVRLYSKPAKHNA